MMEKRGLIKDIDGLMDDRDYRVVINVGGVRFETFVSTLERIPGTRLALLAHLGTADESYDENTGEFFFDRNHRAFEVVLHFHRTEELHMDISLCGNVLKPVSHLCHGTQTGKSSMARYSNW